MAEEFLQTITAPQVLPLVAQAPDRFNSGVAHLWPLLLTWFNFNPSMDK